MLSIAVIIANRNNARFLCQCLDSVISQTLRPEEVVVVDDASTDNSREILDEYARNWRIKLVINEIPIGVAASRHKAIEQSTSEFITTLDADDFYYNPRKLAAEARVITGLPGGKRIAFSDVMRVEENGEPISLVSARRRIREGELSFFIRHMNGFIPRDYLVSRANYHAIGGFNRSLQLYEDWELKIRLSKLCTWHYSGEVGTAYRNNPLGLSRAPRKEHITTMRKIFAMHYPPRHLLGRALDMTRFFIYQSMYLRGLSLSLDEIFTRTSRVGRISRRERAKRAPNYFPNDRQLP